MTVRIDELQTDVTLLPGAEEAPPTTQVAGPRALDEAERDRALRRATLAARTRAEGFDD
jgi:hypothetical protein